MPEKKITTKSNLTAAFAELRKTNPLFELENRQWTGRKQARNILGLQQ